MSLQEEEIDTWRDPGGVNTCRGGYVMTQQEDDHPQPRKEALEEAEPTSTLILVIQPRV